MTDTQQNENWITLVWENKENWDNLLPSEAERSFCGDCRLPLMCHRVATWPGCTAERHGKSLEYTHSCCLSGSATSSNRARQLLL